LTEGNLLREANLHKEAFEALQVVSTANPNPPSCFTTWRWRPRRSTGSTLPRPRSSGSSRSSPTTRRATRLGYTLVDRTDRVEEGMKLIEKALSISPDDAFILDSMGWGYYKLGQYAKSVEYL
jgi:tetratricopeptide (TPR) repeat protein